MSYPWLGKFFGKENPNRGEGEQEEILAQSNDMTPVAGTVEVNIPVHEFWSFLRMPSGVQGNSGFFWALNKDLVLGKQLIWAFQPIRWYYRIGCLPLPGSSSLKRTGR